MRRFRLTLTDSAILVAIIGLICAVPLHWDRCLDRDMCRALGDRYITEGEELAAMAEHPEPWVDPFRDDFRRLSAWQVEKGRRIAGQSRYDAADEQRRIEQAGMDRFEVAFRGRYKQFEGIAAGHGYRRPSLPPPRYRKRNAFGVLILAWPYYVGVIVLGGLLYVRRRSERLRSLPSADRESWAATIGREQAGASIFALGAFFLLFSLFWAADDADGTLGQSNIEIWSTLLARMFGLGGGHGIVSVVALAVTIVGLSINVAGIRESFRRRPVNPTIPDPPGRAGPAEFPRADDPDPSP